MDKKDLKLDIKADVTKDISYSLYKDKVPALKNLSIINEREEDIRNIKLKVYSEPNFLKERILDIPYLPMGKDVELGDLVSLLDKDFLLRLNERQEGKIKLTLEGLEEEFTKEFDTELIPLDQWPGYGDSPELTQVFSQPNDETVVKIYEKCLDAFKEKYNKESFDGYREDKTIVKSMVSTIYDSIDSLMIKYIIPPVNYQVTGQKVRFPEEILNEMFANNLDITMLFSSILEKSGLNPVVIFVKEHVCLGVFLERETFREAVVYDVTSLKKRMAKGVDRLLVFNPVTAMAGVEEDFNGSIEDALERINQEDGFLCAVDIKKARFINQEYIDGNSESNEDYPTKEKELNELNELNELEELEEENKDKNKDKDKEENIVESKGSELGKKKVWERKLLDMTLRNSLINLRMTQSTIGIVSEDLGILLRHLTDGGEIEITARPSQWDNLISDLDKNPGRELSMFKDFAGEEFKEKRIPSLLSKEELEKRGTKILKSSKLSLEENGANTFYLVLGLLKYKPKPMDEEKYAPLILVPVDIVSRISGTGFMIKAREEDIVINVTLLELLKQVYSMDLSMLDPLPMDSEGHMDLRYIFSLIRRVIMNEPGWDVREEACLGLFSFMRFIMWNDIRSNFSEFLKNDVVKSLVEGRYINGSEVIELKNEFVEEDLKENGSIFPVSSDSSQALAVMAAKEGKSFVLHGPPGTGKSQTITNIIANALKDGKRVLFAAQKMAALEVVEKRLNDIGIGSFCLEVHSSKARKKSVLDQLENSMKITRIKKNDDNEITEEVSKRKEELNNIVKSLYKKDETGYSVYDLLSRFASLKDFDKFLVLGEDFDPSDLKGKEEILASVISSGSNAGGPYGHMLQGLNIKEYVPGIKDELKEILESSYKTAGDSLENLVTVGDKLLYPNNLKETVYLYNFTEKASKLMEEEPNVFSLSHIEKAKEELNHIGEKIESLKKEKDEILKNFKEEILLLDPDALRKEFEEGEDKFIVSRLLTGNSALKEINTLSLNHVYKKEEMPKVIEVLKRIKDKTQELIKEIGSKNEILSHSLKDGVNSDPIKVKALGDKIGLFIDEIPTEYREYFLNLTDDEKFLGKSKEYTKQMKESLDKIIRFTNLGDLDIPIGVNPLLYLDERRLEITEGLSSLKDWTIYRTEVKKAEEKGLKTFIEYYEKGQVREEELLSAFRKSVYREILIRRLNSEKELLNLTGKTLEEKVTALEKLINESELLERKNLYQTLASRIPNLILESATSLELGILQRAIRSGARNLSLRKLFKDTGKLLGKIAPCMLMSPMSVAQYLEPINGLFDLVVFDEASQVPTSEAIGSLGRGTQCIIVGDPKQLPPTSFFSSTVNEESEYIEEEDMDNILEDCLALSMTESYLLWHYRSRHESLISFSNRNFYDNMLNTYPSPDDMVSRVTYRKNDGIYERGSSRTNKKEAEEIVEETIKRLKNDKEKSLGIVTFSSVQQNLIEEILVKRFKEDSELEALAYNKGEPLFVKNLENVQGDERDVILFSVGYGLDEEGKISLNFGPINQDGGWRRLNVAVSRARYEMVVFTNIEPESFNVSKSSARGVRDLKNFLQYAKDGRRKITLEEAKKESLNTGLSAIIADRLREEGYKTETLIGSSKFKVDIGIVHPDKPDTFILGIMCGGPSYRDSKSSYDREILQKSVLKGLGWTIHTIYPLDYLEEEEKEIERIKELVETLRRKSKAKEEKEKNPTELENGTKNKINDIDENGNEFDPNEGIPQEKLYEMNNLSQKEMTTDEFMKVSNAKIIAEDLSKIIEIEGPISLELLTKRIKEKYQLTRISEKTEKQVEMILNKEKVYKNQEGERIYYWKDEDSFKNINYFRKTLLEDEVRLLTNIHHKEITNALFNILSGEDLSEKNLIRTLSGTLGYPRLNVENELYIKNIINLLILEGTLIRTPSTQIAWNKKES